MPFLKKKTFALTNIVLSRHFAIKDIALPDSFSSDKAPSRHFATFCGGYGRCDVGVSLVYPWFCSSTLLRKSEHLYCFNSCWWEIGWRHPKSGALQCGSRPKNGALQSWRLPENGALQCWRRPKSGALQCWRRPKNGAKSGRELQFSGNSQGQGVVSIVFS